MKIKLKKGTITNRRLEFEGFEDMQEIPCIYCGQNCEFFGEPYPGDELIHVGFEFVWPSKIDICNGITLEFQELYINGELLKHDKKRAI
ncbi:MAG: hypothetical protein P8X74_03830 [Reinekea sp.]